MDKKVLAEIKLIDSWDLFIHITPAWSSVDENGIVHLLNKNGATAVMMNAADYLEPVKCKETKDENHSMVEEPFET